MRFRVLVTDYDGTIATDGLVDEATIAALQRVRAAGLKLVLITGRELSSLFNTFTRTEIFDRVVAENGAVVLNPASGSVRVVASAPPPQLVEALQHDKIPFSIGHSIVATTRPYEIAVRAAIGRLALRSHVVLNKDAVMVLPLDVDKASGLRHALADLELEEAEVIGLGDAENDQPFLLQCGLAVAVANAIPAVKARAAIVTVRSRGEGVQELVERLLDGDLAQRAHCSTRSTLDT